MDTRGELELARTDQLSDLLNLIAITSGGRRIVLQLQTQQWSDNTRGQ